MRRRICRIPGVLVVGTALALALASGASASSGSITRAEANADWTQGSIAGSVTWSGCQGGWREPGGLPNEPFQTREGCSVQPFVTIGPDTDASGCSSADRRWPHSDEHLTLAWAGEAAVFGSATFDVSAVPLSGEPGQLACLSLRETYEERPQCAFEPGVVCPQYILVVSNYSVLASAPLSAPAPPPTPPVNTGLPQLTGTSAVGKTLTCSDGSWDGDPTGFTYAWLRDGGEIAGESSTTHVVAKADRGHSISCEVTAENDGGSASALSNSLAVPAPPAPPTIVGESATNISLHDATLNAEINPNGLLTRYKLQIDTTGHFDFDQFDSCVLHLPGIACAQIVIPGEPLPPGLVEPPEGALPASLETQHVSVDLVSVGAVLQPETTYHYRAIAASGVQLVAGPGLTFTTPPVDQAPLPEEPASEEPAAEEPPREESLTEPPSTNHTEEVPLPHVAPPVPPGLPSSHGELHGRRTPRCLKTRRSRPHRREHKRSTHGLCLGVGTAHAWFS